MKWTGLFEFRCYNKYNPEVIKWDDKAFNALTDIGEQRILDVFLRGAAGPTQFYIGLTGMAAIAETTSLATLTTEPVGNGYARQLINRDATAAGWPTLVLDAGDYMATSKTVLFEATATWTTIDKSFLSTTLDNTGDLIAYATLLSGVSRTLILNDILEITYKVKLQ